MSRSEETVEVHYPPVVALGITAVAALSILGFLRFYGLTEAKSRGARDVYAIAYEIERFRAPATLLPPGAVIGYVSDVPVNSRRGSTIFLGARYALAPRLLVSDAKDPEWVIGNFLGTTDYPALEDRYHLTLVKDFGNGVAVFRHNAR